MAKRELPLTTLVAAAFGVYFGWTAGVPWSKTLGGIIVVAAALGILGVGETVWSEERYQQLGIRRERRRPSPWAYVGAAWLGFLFDGATILGVGTVVWLIRRLHGS